MASTRLFSNILIYAAFAGLIWRLLSFICAFRGEICPSDMLLRGSLYYREGGSCSQSAATMPKKPRIVFGQRHCVYAACVFFCPPTTHREGEMEEEEGVAKPLPTSMGYQNIFQPQASLLQGDIIGSSRGRDGRIERLDHASRSSAASECTLFRLASSGMIAHIEFRIVRARGC